MEETLDALELPLADTDRRRVLAWARDLVAVERARAVALCRERAVLWESTDLARSPAAVAREEARGRANEATYLADLIAAQG